MWRGSCTACRELRHTSAALEETADGLGTPCANRACSGAAPALSLCPMSTQRREGLNHDLFGRVPRLSCLGPRIARVVESGCATPILGVQSLQLRSAPRRQAASARTARWSAISTVTGAGRPRDGPRRHTTAQSRASLMRPHRLGFVGDDSIEELDKGRRSGRHDHRGRRV